MKTSFLTPEELRDIGFKSLGKNVLISRKASVYSPELISVGNHVRIDDFCIVSGNVTLGSFIHVGSHTVLTGGSAGIEILDFANLSQRVNIFAGNDDYSGKTLTSPVVPDRFKNLEQAKVRIGRHVIIGCGSVVLPGVTMGEGSAVGALSLVNSDTESWMIYVGVPAKAVKERSRELLKLEREFLASLEEDNV